MLWSKGLKRRVDETVEEVPDIAFRQMKASCIQLGEKWISRSYWTVTLFNCFWFFVWSIEFCEKSSQSFKIYLWTISIFPAPNYPTLFEAHQIGNNSLLLQWNMPTQPNGILLGYKIYCTEVNSTYLNDATAFSFVVLDPLKFQTKLPDLRPGATYKIGIAALNCVGESLTWVEKLQDHEDSLNLS